MINTYGGKCGRYKMMQKPWKMIEPLAHWYLISESHKQELSNEYHDRV